MTQEYVLLSIRRHADAGSTILYVVDPHFKEQFEIARPTASYRGLLEAIPEVVVLPEDQVSRLVHLLCQELGECFKQVNASSFQLAVHAHCNPE